MLLREGLATGLQELLVEGGPRLLCKGFEFVVCKSKWKSSTEIPSGEHTCLEVLDRSNPKRATIRVSIELNFMAEFEMTKKSDEYNRLIGRLPAVFVGKAKRLRGVDQDNLLCFQEVHEGKERPHWTLAEAQVHASQVAWDNPRGVSGNVQSRPKQGTSLLTHDLVDMIPGIQCRTAVEVV